MPAGLSTSHHTPAALARPTLARRGLLLGMAATLGACTVQVPEAIREAQPATITDGEFTMPDGAKLPFRTWLPDGPPRMIMLALHGFNDSRDAWEIPAPPLAAAGIAVYAPDQRGFGAAPDRGRWVGAKQMSDDAIAITAILRARHPGLPITLMGESMGGAILMNVATRPDAPDVAGYVLVAPAVWGRARMNIFMRSGLWLAANLVPGMEVGRAPPPIKVFASDNFPALVRLARDPLTILNTRFDTLSGLVDLMDTALAAAPHFTAPALFMYGGHDELVPKPATLATWQALPPNAPTVRAFYPNGWHLLLRDRDRAAPIGDIIAWTQTHDRLLPSGAEIAAAEWVVREARA